MVSCLQGSSLICLTNIYSLIHDVVVLESECPHSGAPFRKRRSRYWYHTPLRHWLTWDSHSCTFIISLKSFYITEQLQAAIDAANPSPMSVLTRLVLTTSTGSVQFWASGQPKPQWNRDEGLADIAVVELVEVPERVETGGEVSEEGFWKRVGRQLVEGRDFPDYAVRFIKRFVTGSYASVSSPVQRIFNSNSTSDKNNTTTFSRDLFGFRQIIVAATHHGKIYGIDSGSGEVVWSRVFGLGWARDVGAKVVPIRIYVLKTVGDDVEGARMKGPEVVVVAQRLADNVGAWLFLALLSN